jgi:hypothetical protein
MVFTKKREEEVWRTGAGRSDQLLYYNILTFAASQEIPHIFMEPESSLPY